MERFGRSVLAAAKGECAPKDGYAGTYIDDLGRRVVEAKPGLLDLDPAEARTRLDSADKPFDRLEAEQAEFHGRVRDAFLDLAAAEADRFLVLDAAAAPEVIAERIRTRVAALLD